MADDALERVLRLVSEGHLSAEEAGPILDALANRPPAPAAGSRPGRAAARPATGRPGRSGSRSATPGGSIINLRVPLSLGRAAISRVPGISELTSDRIREAIAAGVKGSIVEVEDDGDGVRISIE